MAPKIVSGSGQFRKKITLAGKWDMSIGNVSRGRRVVPSSYPPRGCVTLSRNFSINVKPGCRYFLQCEGILSQAAISINGKEYGTIGPWVPYEIEFSPVNGENTVAVTVTDIAERIPEVKNPWISQNNIAVNFNFGPCRGRLFHGGHYVRMNKIWA